jgi:type II secretion system protein G
VKEMKKFIGGGCCGKKKGFTLIELLIVVAIIGLLATLAILSLTSAQAKARDTKRVADLKSLQNGIEMYYNDNSHYPYLTAASTTWANLQTALASQLNALPAPPNTDYDYEYATNGTTGSVYCLRTQLEKDNQILDQDDDVDGCDTTTPATVTVTNDTTAATSTQDCDRNDSTAGAPYQLCIGN